MASRDIKAIAELAAGMRARVLEQQRVQERRRSTPRSANVEVPVVNPFAARHGDYRPGTVVDLSGELGGGRMRMVKVMLNRGGSAIDRWMTNDSAGIFGESEQRAIRYCQNLWTRAEGNLKAVDHSADVVDAPLGWAQQEAIVELKRLEERVPRPYWQCYENVCRFDQEAGAAGSSIASNPRSAIDAAKTTVAFTASLIAMWRRL